MSVEYFFHNIKEQTSDNYDNYGEPSRATGQQLNKHKVHVLGMQKWPKINEKIGQSGIFLGVGVGENKDGI